jgi:VanZ family protein
MRNEEKGRAGVRIFLSCWLPLMGYCVLIFVQSSHPVPNEISRLDISDKALHVAGYALLGALFYRAYRSLWGRFPERTLFWASAVSAALYGLSDEIHQYFVPFRSADPLDFAADAFGGLLGAAAWMVLLAAHARHRSHAP